MNRGLIAIAERAEVAFGGRNLFLLGYKIILRAIFAATDSKR